MGNFLRRAIAIQLMLISMAHADGFKITVPPMEDKTVTDEQRDLNEAYNVLFPKCADGSRAVALPCAKHAKPLSGVK